MTASYRALCTDFYVNHKLSVKLDLPRGRETMLDLFERVRREFPSMSNFRRYKEELALETPPGEGGHRWLAIRSSNLRSGVVNPETFDEAYGLHRLVLEVAPYFLSISPLDIEYLEVLYGFDLSAGGNQDALVAQALLDGSPLAALTDVSDGVMIDFQPLLGLLLRSRADAAVAESEIMPETEVSFEVKTRSSPGARGEPEARGEPISVYVTLRRHEPVGDLKALPDVFNQLTGRAQRLIEDKVLGSLLGPIREAIALGDA